jgi:hypothetical protein
MQPPSSRINAAAAHLYGIPESNVGGQLKVPKAQPCNGTCPVALFQPLLYAGAVVAVPSGHHHWVAHQFHGHRAVKACQALWHSRLVIITTSAIKKWMRWCAHDVSAYSCPSGRSRTLMQRPGMNLDSVLLHPQLL